MGIYFETSERSDQINWVKEYITGEGFKTIAFEGYTVKNNKVSLLLDRFAFEYREKKHSLEEIYQLIRNFMKDDYDYKIKFSKQMDIQWYILCYQYPNKSILVKPERNKVSIIKKFNNFEEFGEWTYQYRDLCMKSKYEEDGLPDIDKVLRRNKTPWPGNLDGLLIYKGECVILIEYQRTVKKSVKDHCNNQYFYNPNSKRKDDVNRWKVAEIISKSTQLPILILVWSEKEEEIKFKLIEKIVYPGDKSEDKIGLHYYFDDLVKKNDIKRNLTTICESLSKYEVK